MNPFLVCVAVLVIFYFALSLYVSLMRQKYRVGVGIGDDPSSPLGKAVRAQGNASEYVPIFIALFVYFAIAGSGAVAVWIAVIVTACRILHALGMIWTKTFAGPPHPLRSIGAVGTYLGGFALGVIVLMRTFM